MRFYFLFILAVLVAGCVRNPATQHEKDQIFSIDGDPVYADEFLYHLNKNNYQEDSVLSAQEIREYLELYINFKLKVHEAKKAGYDTTDAYQTEYKKYLEQLSESYLKDDSIVEELVREAYDHLQHEIKASHILIRVENPANPEDTAEAYHRISGIYRMAQSGKDFNQLAVEFSEDPSAVSNRGNLGYFTGLQMVYPFEEAAYSTPKGEISKPFRTRFGYHILKVEEIRPAQGKVEVAHIMLALNRASGEMDSIQIVNRINAIYDSLKLGGNWEYFCKKYSDDINSKNNNGLLRPFETGRTFPDFSEAAFSLKNPGDISKPVLTPYGWHIVRLIRKYPPDSFEDLRDELVSKVKQDSRSNISREILIDKLKKENGFSANENLRNKITPVADSSLLVAEWTYDPSLSYLDSTLFWIGDRRYPVGEFFEYVRLQQKPVSNMAPSFYFNQLYDNYLNREIIAFEKRHLGDKFPEYRMISREYAEGILLFDIMDKKVWSYATRDSSGLLDFYEKNISRYQWGPRLEAVLFKSSDPDLINDVRVKLSEPYYYLSDPVLLFPARNETKLDSINQLLSKNRSWRLELSPGMENDLDKLMTILQNHGFDSERIIVNPGGKSQTTVRIMSFAKKDLDKFINDKWGVNLHIESGLYQQGDHEIIDLIEWNEGIHDLSIEENDYIVYVEQVLPPMDQQLNEIQGRVISDYQQYLEQKWVKELREKYDIHINNRLLKQIINDFENR